MRVEAVHPGEEGVTATVIITRSPLKQYDALRIHLLYADLLAQGQDRE